MSDDKTAEGLSAEDAALVAEFGAENVNVDQPNPADLADEVSDVDQEEESTETTDEEVETEPVQEEPPSEEEPEPHDTDLTLKENEPTQSQVDGENLAVKWESLTEDEQASKLANLKKGNRTETLNTLAEKLGTSTDDLLKDVGTEPEAVDMDALKAEIKRELAEEMRPEMVQSELNRFAVEIAKWGEHNKLSTENIESLSKVNGEVFKSFNKLKFDPETGQELSFKGKLRLALKNDTAQSLVSESFASQKSQRVANAQIARLPGEGSVTAPKPDLMDIADDQEFLDEADRLSGMSRWN